MKLATVVGNVVATAHHPTYDGHKVMVVTPQAPDESGQWGKSGETYLAVDLVQAGPGDRVLVLTEGNGVRQLIGPDSGPIRSVIVGIVDHVQLGA